MRASDDLGGYERGTHFDFWRPSVIPKMVSTIAPVHPVPLKPRSNIRTWEDWPEDVQKVLKTWNSNWLLSFYGSRVYKCSDCSEYCEGHSSVAFQNHEWVCDDCLIDRARSALKGDNK